METPKLRRVGYVTRIQDVVFYRKTVSRNYVKHYTTKVLVILDGELRGLDGFGITDYFYIRDFAVGRGVSLQLYLRRPKFHNSILVAEYKGTLYITRMSADTIWEDSEAREFYLKPLSRRLSMRYEYLVDSLHVIDQYGNITEYSKYEPKYMPCIKPSWYPGEKPDLTLVVYDSTGRRHVVDVFSDYYVYRVRDYPLFMGYLQDLVELEVVPPVTVETERVDTWRVRSRTVRTIDASTWFKLTDYEWCGAYSRTQVELEKLFKFLRDNIGRGYDMVCSVIHYTSNVFVAYIDIWVRGVPSSLMKVLERLELIRELAGKEIIESIFRVGG